MLENYRRICTALRVGIACSVALGSCSPQTPEDAGETGKPQVSQPTRPILDRMSLESMPFADLGISTGTLPPPI